MSENLDKYYSIKGPSSGEFKDRGSKFFGYLYPVTSLEEFEKHLIDLRKEHLKARHYCYAYRLNFEEELFRMNDDGEPSGTAGKPIYGQLLKHNLFDVACVVVRYFGGTKLGTSGLINAYKLSALDAIQQADIEDRYLTHSIKFEFDYAQMGEIMELVKSQNIFISSKTFEQTPILVLNIPKSETELTLRQLKAKLLKVDLEYIDIKSKVPGCTFSYL